MKKSPPVIPFFRPDIGTAELLAVSKVLKSGWLNTGRETEAFEQELQKVFSAQKVVCLNSCWAALFISLKAFGVGKGDEVITTPHSFVATANCILHCGATPVFVDIDHHHIDPKLVEKKINKKTKVILAVDLAGYPAPHHKLLKAIESKAHLFRPANEVQRLLKRPLLLSDAAHCVGTGLLKNKKPTGLLVDVACYSFHTVKNITTADGGAIAIFNPLLCRSSKKNNFLNDIQHYIHHGMNNFAYQREKAKSHRYDVALPGYKLNMTDVAAALGRAQLKRLETFRQRREKIISIYDKALAKQSLLIHSKPHFDAPKNYHYKIFPHLYFVEINKKLDSSAKKLELMKRCKERGIILNEHYVPITSLAYYKDLIGRGKAKKMSTTWPKTAWPMTYWLWYRCLTLPLYPTLKKQEAQKIIDTTVQTARELFGEN